MVGLIRAHLTKQRGLPFLCGSHCQRGRQNSRHWIIYFLRPLFVDFKNIYWILTCLFFLKGHMVDLKWKDVNLLLHSCLLSTQPVQPPLCLSFPVTLGFQITFLKSQLLSLWASDYCREIRSSNITRLPVWTMPPFERHLVVIINTNLSDLFTCEWPEKTLCICPHIWISHSLPDTPYCTRVFFTHYRHLQKF